MEIGIIMVTAYGTVETAVQAIQDGAYNYFIKSNDPSTLLLDIERFLQLKELKIENSLLKNQNKEISMLESNNPIMKLSLIHIFVIYIQSITKPNSIPIK